MFKYFIYCKSNLYNFCWNAANYGIWRYIFLANSTASNYSSTTDMLT